MAMTFLTPRNGFCHVLVSLPLYDFVFRPFLYSEQAPFFFGSTLYGIWFFSFAASGCPFGFIPFLRVAPSLNPYSKNNLARPCVGITDKRFGVHLPRSTKCLVVKDLSSAFPRFFREPFYRVPCPVLSSLLVTPLFPTSTLPPPPL